MFFFFFQYVFWESVEITVRGSKKKDEKKYRVPLRPHLVTRPSCLPVFLCVSVGVESKAVH